MHAELPHPSRLGSLSAVVLLHAVAIGLFASGLSLRPSAPETPPPVVLKDPVELPPPPPEPLPVPRDVVLEARPIIEVPIPDVPTSVADAPITVSAAELPRSVAEPGPLPLPPADLPREPSLVASQPVAAGLLCSRMPPPEMPVALDQAAELSVIGTVRGGRVVAVEFTASRGLTDRRALRQLQQAVDRTLRDGYQCSSEGRFTQAFLFKPE